MLSEKLLEVLACPKCHAKVELKGDDKLECTGCHLQYPIIDDIPVMLIEEAKPAPDQTDATQE
jgi:uncharacterized protein YbaR (Trm112 family)